LILAGGRIEVTRRTVATTFPPVTMTSPDGGTRTITLNQTSPGLGLGGRTTARSRTEVLAALFLALIVIGSPSNGFGGAMTEEKEDEELTAIKTVLGVLTPLQPEARNNVIDYVLRRLGITAPVAAPAQLAGSQSVSLAAPVAPALQSPPLMAPTDLRSLTEQKQPKSANQMVAILAYYLANSAAPRFGLSLRKTFRIWTRVIAFSLRPFAPKIFCWSPCAPM
jgi:hypothetical protein